MMDPNLIQAGIGLLTVGAAFGGARAALNGTRARVVELALDHEALTKSLAVHEATCAEESRKTTERLARVETKIDIILGGIPLTIAVRKPDED
jgi:two-component sensor histidine kinase